MLPSMNEAASMQLSVRQSSVVLSSPPPDEGEGLNVDTVTPNTIASTTNANIANISPIPVKWSNNSKLWEGNSAAQLMESIKWQMWEECEKLS